MSNRKDLMRIALATQDDRAILATEILASMNRQGFLHPKECTPIWIALETSQNTKIAELSFRVHRTLHEKHETILEREYMRAVQLAYEYQRDVIQNTRGATFKPYLSKLHMLIDVMKISKAKNRKAFYNNLCTQIDVDLGKMGNSTMLYCLEHSQFIIENMAFFEYVSVDELISAIAAMEIVTNRAGIIIANMIDTEIFHASADQASPTESDQSLPASAAVDPARLRTLTASSMIVSCLWDARTYLRRQYGLLTAPCDGKRPNNLNGAPIKVQGVNGDTFWDKNSMMMAAMDSEQSMLTQCRAFVESFHGAEEEGRSTPTDNEESRKPSSFTNGENGRKRISTGTSWSPEMRTGIVLKKRMRKKRKRVLDDDEYVPIVLR
jgi:cohesin loading factor subunit SCC2